ncbi:NAD(P)-binding Rossmann-fold containing protein [Glarea lozoyensis ATCC 20868]|uniref:NAD(P)-binding Rossmann-fold containing protein n=1 Tax=Glarea lozoyensis (strain ATCC 20868 / MF5171) TaxID=1116229 RepID=S3D4P1_GLAL2|nr:NAD(P)-binding Rossmann-fold containing protein [Glarea lozoyensis ATCC 20868]EPE33412.1 NAD(P)-binding Rossmann-fold containing protein [Glarea lozoyensis ATCC 20868]
MATNFDISPEKANDFSQFLYRQFFTTPSPVSPETVNLTGQTAIVTGSNGGIGLEVCKQLLGLGLSKLIIAVRDESKGDAAAASLSVISGESVIEVWPLDMLSYDSIIALTERASTLKRLDIVILNAAITRLYFQLNPSTGHEENIQVKLSLDRRIVIVSTDAAGWGTFPERNSDPLLPAFDEKEPTDMLDRYYTSKLLQHFFLREVVKHVPSSTATIILTSPGLVYGTEALRDGKRNLKGLFDQIGSRLIVYSPEVGARQIIDAATRNSADIHGQFLCSQKLTPLAPIIYTTEGKNISARLWLETLEQLSFAELQEILKGIML